MRSQEFVARVQELGGFAEKEQAERAIQATLATLSERLVATEVRALATELPRPIAEALACDAYCGDFDLAEFYHRVCQRQGVDRSFGVEHAQVVCRVLAEGLTDDARTRLHKELSPPLADLFRIPPRPSRLGATLHLPPRGPEHTLATGRPGSLHPLSESRLDLAQSHSVARPSCARRDP